MTNQMKESQNMKLLHGDNVKKVRQLDSNVKAKLLIPCYKHVDTAPIHQ